MRLRAGKKFARKKFHAARGRENARVNVTRVTAVFDTPALSSDYLSIIQWFFFCFFFLVIAR